MAKINMSHLQRVLQSQADRWRARLAIIAAQAGSRRVRFPSLPGGLNGTARARRSRLRGGEPYQDRNRKGRARCQRHPVFLVQPHFHFQLLRPTGQSSR